MNYSLRKKDFMIPKIPYKFKNLEEAHDALYRFQKLLNDIIISMEENDMHTYEDYYSKYE